MTTEDRVQDSGQDEVLVINNTQIENRVVLLSEAKAIESKKASGQSNFEANTEAETGNVLLIFVYLFFD